VQNSNGTGMSRSDGRHFIDQPANQFDTLVWSDDADLAHTVIFGGCEQPQSARS